MSRVDTSSQSNAWSVAGVLALALGLWLRLTALEVQSLWFDEGGTLGVALAADPFELLRLDRHPPLSFLAFRAWVTVFGESDVAVRMLPALALFGAGVLLGVGLGMMLAPKPGRELRDDLRERLGKGANGTADAEKDGGE